jgi:hypothetical protein
MLNTASSTKLDITCEQCGSKRILFGIQYSASGSLTIIAKCDKCGNRPQSKHPFYNKADFDLTKLQIWEDYRQRSEPCAVCKSRNGSEYHHFAPRHLFGDDADMWPGAWLCKEHHDQWHNIVTPNMRKAKK